jgi:purine-binding chemotaxis protein CheW
VNDDERRLLEARARALARPPGRAAPPGLETVVFRLGGERYGVPLLDIVRILPIGELAPLPGARPPHAGVAPWRGGLLPLLDLRLLRRASPGIGDLTRVVVIGDEQRPVGLLAEGVEDIATIDTAALQAVEAGDGERHVRGILPDAVVLLDTGGLLRLHRGG